MRPSTSSTPPTLPSQDEQQQLITHRNDQTNAELSIMNRGFAECTILKAKDLTATRDGLQKDIKIYLAGNVPSAKPLSPDLFNVTYNGTVYNINMPKPLVPLVLALEDFVITNKITAYVLHLSTVTVVTEGSGKLGDNNWATVKVHKHEGLGFLEQRKVVEEAFLSISLHTESGKRGYNPIPGRDLCHAVNFAFSEEEEVGLRHRLHTIRKIKMQANADCYFGKKFCKAFGVCEQCARVNRVTDYNPCDGRCAERTGAKRAHEASSSSTFSSAADADF